MNKNSPPKADPPEAEKLKIKLLTGQAIMVIVLFMLFLGGTGIMAFSFLVINRSRASSEIFTSEKSYFLAEAGTEDVAYRLRTDKSVDYLEFIKLDGSTATVTVADINGGKSKEISSLGSVSDSFRRIRTVLGNSTGATFNYGVQVGRNGIVMHNNAEIHGSIYTNGDILGAPGTKITGEVLVSKGTGAEPNQAHDIQDSSFVFGARYGNKNKIDAGQGFKPSNVDAVNFVSLKIKKINNPASFTVKIVKDASGKPSDADADTLAKGAIDPSQVSQTVFGYIDVSLDKNPVLDPTLNYWVVADTERDDSNYWEWAMDSAEGYAPGAAKYSADMTTGNWTAITGDLNFKVWVGGEHNSIQNMAEIKGANIQAYSIVDTAITSSTSTTLATIFSTSTTAGNIRADTVRNCTIGGMAEYNVKQNPCYISGLQITPTIPPEELPPLAFPVSDSLIQDWKNNAQNGCGIPPCIISSGNYNPPNDATTTIGPGVIEGNLILDNKERLVLSGTVWVKGNIDIANNGSIVLDPSYGPDSGVLFANSWIHVANNGVFRGSGEKESYLLIMTLVPCEGGEQTSSCTNYNAAMELSNNAEGAIFYAPNGLIFLHNNISVTELNGKGLVIDNNSIVVYELGLINVNFKSGPSGGWVIDNWEETE